MQTYELNNKEAKCNIVTSCGAVNIWSSLLKENPFCDQKIIKKNSSLEFFAVEISKFPVGHDFLKKKINNNEILTEIIFIIEIKCANNYQLPCDWLME